MRYMDEKRPRLVEFLKTLDCKGLWDSGKPRDGVDFRLLEEKANEALAADQAEAGRDDSKWASLE